MYEREFSAIATASGPNTQDLDWWWKRNQLRASEFAAKHADDLAEALYGEDPDLKEAFLDSFPKEMAIDALYTFGVHDLEDFMETAST